MAEWCTYEESDGGTSSTMVLIMCIHDAGVGGGGEVPLKCVKMGWSIEA